MTGEYQKELFKEFQKGKGKLKKIADKVTGRQRKLYLHATLENVVFVSIIVIMCIIVAFALGVERGKRLGLQVTPQPASQAPEKPANFTKPVKANIEKKREPEDPYIIQLISYKTKSRALGEKSALAERKINAFILPSGKWYQVCTGGYESVKDARKAMEAFKNDYKGCFVRKIEKNK